MILFIISILGGGLVLRAVGQVNLWLDGNDYLNRPAFLNNSRNLASSLVILAMLITYPSSAAIGWSHWRWAGAVSALALVYATHIAIGLLVDKRLPLRITHSRPLNPILHLSVLPYFLLAVAVWSLLHRHG